MASASVKILESTRKNASLQYGNLSYKPQFHVIATKPVETTTQALSRLLFESGQLDRSAYDAVRGIQYDADVEHGKEDFDWSDDLNDDYIQSSFANYEEFMPSSIEPNPQLSPSDLAKKSDLAAEAPADPATKSVKPAEAPADPATKSVKPAEAPAEANSEINT